MTRMRLPSAGRPHAQLLEEMASFQRDDIDWQGGKTWSLLYPVSEEHEHLLERTQALFMNSNGLNPMAFKSLKRLESEVVQMTASMLNGPSEAVGTMTSGGTESILMAVKAARDRARRLKPWIRRPELVVPRTIHVAFDKAAHYFDLKPRYVTTNDDGRVDVPSLRRAINRNTVLIAASAPQYPHGVVDPIPEIGALALKKKIPFHVDGCFGGFILPWLEKLGVAIPPWDFRVPGVTSISADVHKYGYAAKGASLLVYRSIDYLKYQFFISTDWPGGIYASPTMAGTRAGGPIAAAWAAMQAMGEDGYLELARKALDVTRELRAGVEAIPGLAPVAELQSTVVTWRSVDPDVDTYAVADQLAAKGWAVDRQQHPACVHCSVNAWNAASVEPYLADLAAAVEHVRAHPELRTEGEAAMYGMMAKVPLRGLVKHSVAEVMAGMYAPDGQAPDLSKVGEGADDGPLLQFLSKYGDQAMALLDRLDGLRGGRGGRR